LEDYDGEVLNEEGYVAEFSNKGEKRKPNPNYFNLEKKEMKCLAENCSNRTKSVRCMCSKHGKLNDYPLHDRDWIGRIIPPGKSRDEFKTWALPHNQIAILLIKWIRGDEKKGKQMDDFMDNILLRFHKKVPDATTLQKNLEGQKNEGMHPDDVVRITKELIDRYFPSKPYENQYIENTEKFRDTPLHNLPFRILLATQVLALVCEESNRGDACMCAKLNLEPKYANMFMPLLGYLLMRKGATRGEIRMCSR